MFEVALICEISTLERLAHLILAESRPRETGGGFFYSALIGFDLEY
jgi:hypothetical protein